jgi:hypothetical protein
MHYLYCVFTDRIISTGLQPPNLQTSTTQFLPDAHLRKRYIIIRLALNITLKENIWNVALSISPAEF